MSYADESICLTYSFGQLSLAKCPPVATIVGTVEPNVTPNGGRQHGAVAAQGHGLDPPRALVVVDGLSTRFCAPQVHTAYTQDNATQSISTFICFYIYPSIENEGTSRGQNISVQGLLHLISYKSYKCICPD